MRGIVNHGMYKRYYHDEVGVNSRLDSVQAAVLRVKLPALDSYNAARRSAADYYDKAFNHPNILTPKRSKKTLHTFSINIHSEFLNGKRNELQAF